MSASHSKAEESPQVRKARKKLRKKFEEQDKLVTITALEKMRMAINTWLTRHKEERTKVSAERWDANKHPAQSKSKHVSQLMQKLQNETKKGATTQRLRGRIKSD